MPVVLKMTMDRPADVGISAFRRFTKAAHKEQGDLWVERYLPKHFEADAASRYRYKPRSKKYRAKKRALAKHGIVKDGGARALVFKGISRDDLLGFQAVRAFPTRAVVNMAAPRHWGIRFRTDQPDKADELTRVIPAERRVLVARLDKSVHQQIEVFRRTKRKRVKV